MEIKRGGRTALDTYREKTTPMAPAKEQHKF